MKSTLCNPAVSRQAAVRPLLRPPAGHRAPTPGSPSSAGLRLLPTRRRCGLSAPTVFYSFPFLLHRVPLGPRALQESPTSANADASQATLLCRTALSPPAQRQAGDAAGLRQAPLRAPPEEGAVRGGGAFISPLPASEAVRRRRKREREGEGEEGREGEREGE